MKFLKVLINSLLTGFFFCVLVALLIYDLNINLSFQFLFFGQITVFLIITYGLLIAVLTMLLFFVFEFILGKSFKIALISPSFLALSFSLVMTLFLLAFKANYDYFLSFFDGQTRELLNNQAMTLVFLSVLGVVCFYAFQSYRKGVVFLCIYFLFFGVGLYYVFLQRISYPVPQLSKRVANLEAKQVLKKVTIIGLEGLSFDVMIPLINEEKLPNFAYLMEQGAWGKMENFSPTDPLILNTSFSSGKYPAKHRRISRYKYRVLNWEDEFEVAPRFMFFGQLLRTGLMERSSQKLPSYATDIWSVFQDNHTAFLVKDWPYNRAVEKPLEKAEARFNLIFKDLRFDTSSLFDKVRQAFYADFEFEEQVMVKKSETQAQIVYFSLNGLNIVESYFYKYSFPDFFGNIDQDEINKYSSVIEEYYQFYDDIIGKYMASLKEDELFMVFSSHGIEPLPLWKRVVEWMLGNADISAYYELAPEGVGFFYGREILRGKNVQRMRIVDMAPTLLNYMGLPVGKDMDGIVLSSIFREEFKLENPVLYISSYKEHAIKQPN